MNEKPCMSLIFFDPLLETINFTKEIVRMEHILEDKARWEVFADLIKTYEMSRLLFCKQAGLNFLKFPSATHNRFAHSIGCWMLGADAMDNVRVHVHNTYISLLEWLMNQDKALEFLAALLLHDCGHGPFSHVLEINPLLNYSHEEIGGQLIRGEGPFAEEIQQRAKSMPTVHQVLLDHNLDYELIALMIAGDKEDFRDNFAKFWAVRHLVEGDIDIDRLDHYQRDSFYMGTKLAHFNMTAFLENIVLYPQHHTKNIRVTNEGIPHALALLHAKELIFLAGLDCDEIRSYEAMLNSAVSFAINKGILEIHDTPFLTEDELMYKLKEAKSIEVQTLLSQLLSRLPYQFIHEADVGPGMKRKELDNQLASLLRRARLEMYDVVAYVPFRDTPKEADRWLNLCDIEGNSLDSRFYGFTEALAHATQRRQHRIRFFARTEEVAKKIVKTLQKEF